jgi:hypothetical protein
MLSANPLKMGKPTGKSKPMDKPRWGETRNGDDRRHGSSEPLAYPTLVAGERTVPFA